MTDKELKKLFNEIDKLERKIKRANDEAEQFLKRKELIINE